MHFFRNLCLKLWSFNTLFWWKKFHWEKNTSRLISQLGNVNYALLLWVSPYLSLTHLIHLHSEPVKQDRDMVPMRKILYSNKALPYFPTEASKGLLLASTGIELYPQESPLPFIQTQQREKRGVCNLDAEEETNTIPGSICLSYQRNTVGLCQCNWPSNSYCNRVQ